MRQLLKSISRSGLDFLLRTPAGTSLYKRLYEASPHKIADLIVRLQTQPKFDLLWTTRLMNGKKVRIQVHADDRRSWEFAHAYHWHDVEIRDLEWAILRKYAADGIEPIFIDIGANMGLRSLLPLSMGLHCILFEPNGELRDFTTELFALNELGGYELANVCLGNRVGTAAFYLSANPYMSSLDSGWAADQGTSRKIEVPMTTLDDWMAGRPELSQRAALLKIDVEGAELGVLEGGRQYIARLRPPVICEVDGNPARRGPIWDYCSSLGYGINSVRNACAGYTGTLDRSAFIALSGEANFVLTPLSC